MTITPQQAEKLNEANIAEVKSLEAKIDDAILMGFEGRGDRVIFGIPRGVGSKVLKEITKIYSVAGWSVKYQSDQRDGDYLEFRPKRHYEVKR